MTQKDLIRYHLETYGDITPAEALNRYGIMRLGARIWELKSDGMPIETAMRRYTNRFGKPVHVAEYRLKKGAV